MQTSVPRRLRLEPLEDRDLLAVVASLGLQSAVINGTVASLDLTLEYAATAGEKLAYFSLDVEPSSPELIGPGPDYSAFSFAKASPLLDDWTQLGFFNEPGFESSVEFDDSLTASLPSGTYTLGTLSVDFGAIGLSLGSSFTVAINGQGTVIGVDSPQNGFVFEPVSFNPASRTVTPVSVSGPASVTEGSPYTLTVHAPDTLVVNLFIDWGDGQQQTINAADLPASRTVTHTFSDGPFSPAIVIDLVDEDGTHSSADSLAVTVTNVVPVVSLSGAVTVSESSPYILTIGSVDDPGADTVSQYVVHWGDDQQQTINADDLPTTRTVTHTYTDGPLSPTILIDVVDEDGTHTSTASLALTVTNVGPNVSLSGPSTISEDSVYTLTVEGIHDPRNDTVRQIVIDWGDGPPETIDVDDIPDDEEITHSYLVGPASVTILVDLIGADGTHLAEFTLRVDILGDGLVLDHFDTTASVPGETPRHATVFLTAEFTDLRTPETHTAVVDWGDGSEPQTAVVTETDSVGVVTATHEYEIGGVFTVTLTITDPQGTTETGEAKAYITGSRLLGDILQIVGSDGNDIVTVTPQGQADLFVNITTPPAENVRSTYALANVRGIDVYVGAGNDRVMVSERLTIETYIDGGPNDDHVQGGDGLNMLLGGPGNDAILGGASRDFLVGGTGRNQLLGYGSDDVLIGGDWRNPDDQRAEIFALWNSAISLDVRDAMISESIDVTADADPDSLFGGDGENLYYVSEFDLIEDGHSPISYTVEQAIALGWASPHEQWGRIFTATPGAPEPTAARGSLAQPGDAPTVSAESESVATDLLPRSNPQDVNGDGFITPQDVVVVINALNSDRAGQVTDRSRYLDANQDGWITPLDALGTVNYLNARVAFVEGEAPSAVGSPAVIAELRDPGDWRVLRRASRDGVTTGTARLLPSQWCDASSAGASPSRGNLVWPNPLLAAGSGDPRRTEDHNLERVLNAIAGDIACAIPSES